MLILVFDTCFNKSYIVLRNDNEIISSEVIESTQTNYHSAYLIPKLRDVLKKNNYGIKDLGAIGVNIGPGSFTGIRAGITIARVLAQQYNIKICPVPSLKILSNFNKSEKPTAVMLDARKNKIYFAKYNHDKEIYSPQLIDKDEIKNYVDKNDFIVSDKSIQTFLAENNINSTCYEDDDNNIGKYLSEIVFEKLKNHNDNYNWAKVKPLYIQPPSITKSKEVKNV